MNENMSAVYLPLLLSVSAFLISAVSFFFFRAYLKRRTGQERILAELREEVNNILKSINETVDRDISLIEEREKILKSLLTDIEKRVKVYIREMETRKEAESAYAALSPKKSSGGGPQAAEVDFSPHETGESLSVTHDKPSETYAELGKKRYHGRKQRLSSAPESAREREAPESPVKKEIPAGNAAPALLSAAETPPLGTPPVGEQIHSLMRAGLPAPAIASRLGISIAEVEFAAALLERRDAPR